MSISIGISFEWDERPGDGRLCYNCESVMIGKMFVLCLFINNMGTTEVEESKTKIICEHCKINLDDSNSNP